MHSKFQANYWHACTVLQIFSQAECDRVYHLPQKKAQKKTNAIVIIIEVSSNFCNKQHIS